MFTSWISKRLSFRSTPNPSLLSHEAHRLKKAEKWVEAGRKYEEAAAASAPNSQPAANFWSDAADCYRKENCSEALRAFKKAVEIFKELRKASTAARILEEAAEMLKSEGRIDEAVSTLEEAADLFSGDNHVPNSFGCFAKAADLIVESRKNFDKAEVYYLKAIKQTSRDSTVQYAVVCDCLKACLCRLIYQPEKISQLVRELRSRCWVLQMNDEVELMNRLASLDSLAETDACGAEQPQFKLDFKQLNEAIERYFVRFQHDKDNQMAISPIDNAMKVLLNELEMRVKANSQLT